jgi:hypothetical protein
MRFYFFVDDMAYTVTFGDVAENHAKMQQIGEIHESGYTCEQLITLGNTLEAQGYITEWIDLANEWNSEMEAGVLVIRQGIQRIFDEYVGGSVEELCAEHDALVPDKQAKMRGKVVNKHARWNLCFDEEDQSPDYEDGKGTIVSWKRIPLTQCIREKVQEWTGDKDLKGESNVYYDPSKCGIGYHGDGERKKVFAARFGESEKVPLYFQWFQNSLPVGERIRISLQNGDMYAMSEKAVGFDWLKKKIPTLRHAAGCDKYTLP